MGLKELRVKAGQTQEALANAIGSTQGSVSHWECGDNRPPFRMIPLIAKALGTSADAVIAAIEEVPVKC